MEKKSVSLIEVLNELSEKSDYEFFYNDNEVKGVKVSVSVKDATVSEILDHVLQGTALKYQIVDHVIVIRNSNCSGRKILYYYFRHLHR